MKIILNDYSGAMNFKVALRELVKDANTLSLAVSYLQVGGWELLHHETRRLALAEMKIVCTDQMGITQPSAVKLAMSSGVQIRNYAGQGTYHPKVFLNYDCAGHPARFLISSANLSFAAFNDSVEAGLLGSDAEGLRTLNAWFNDLFRNRSEEFTPERLRRMEETWRKMATSRIRTRLRKRREFAVPPGPILPPFEAEDLDTLEDIFATVQLPIGLLNMDYAGNNIRNVGRVREVLADWASVANSGRPVAGKQRNELKLLGFADGRNLTPLGQAAARAASREEVARLWCSWLQRTPDNELAQVNERLLAAKRVFTQFWRLNQGVRDYFLANAERPTGRKTLQTVELLCNASDLVQNLSIDDFRTLAPLLDQPQRLPQFVQAAIADYQENKGTRGWDYPDRRIVPLAWHETQYVV
jgi:hypothetical protein